MNGDISTKIREVNQNGEGAFIPYIMAGDPTPEKSLKYAKALEQGGADVIELGVPYSDPVADGPTIQSAGSRALSSMSGLKDVLSLVHKLKEEINIPVILMSYYNPILQFGEDRFAAEARKAGVNGLILPDLPIEEGSELWEATRNNSLETPLLVTPDTNEHRLSNIVDMTSGFLYLVSRSGTTGAKTRLERTTMRTIDFVNSTVKGNLPVCVGFGLSTPGQVKEVINGGANGAIVGSAIVDRIGEGQKPEEIRKFVSELKAGTLKSK